MKRERIAKIVRAASVPPVWVALLLILVYALRPGVFAGLGQMIAVLICLAGGAPGGLPHRRADPQPAPQGAGGRRNLAFVMNLAGYVLAWGYALISRGLPGAAADRVDLPHLRGGAHCAQQRPSGCGPAATPAALSGRCCWPCGCWAGAGPRPARRCWRRWSGPRSRSSGTPRGAGPGRGLGPGLLRRQRADYLTGVPSERKDAFSLYKIYAIL